MAQKSLEASFHLFVTTVEREYTALSVSGWAIHLEIERGPGERVEAVLSRDGLRLPLLPSMMVEVLHCDPTGRVGV